MDNKPAFSATKISKFKALGKDIIVSDMPFDERIVGNIVLLNDDMKSSGIRPRWAKIYALGSEQQDLEIGQYVLISHGRWTRGIKIEDEDGAKTIRKVDPKDILMVSDEPVLDGTMGDKVF